MTDYTLQEWVHEWLYTYKRIMIKPSTFDSYIQYCTNVTCNKQLSELQTSDIQGMINCMIAAGKQLSTIKHMLTIVRQSLRKARLLGLIESLSCMDNIELPRARPKPVKGLTDEQARLVLDNSARSYYGPLFSALLLTGCRVGELIALRWHDVDFFNNCIYITNTDYNGSLQPVKTANGVRCLPMYGRFADIIRQLHKQPRGERVFLNTLGRPVVYRTLLDDWHWFCSHVGLYDCVGLHTLRHTFARMSIRAGVPIKVVSAWMGHADVRITLNIYDSVDAADMVHAAETLEEMFA